MLQGNLEGGHVGGGVERLDEFQKTGEAFAVAASDSGDTAFAPPALLDVRGFTLPSFAFVFTPLKKTESTNKSASRHRTRTDLRLPISAIKSIPYQKKDS